MSTYIAFYNGKYISVTATDADEARVIASTIFKINSSSRANVLVFETSDEVSYDDMM